MLELRLPTHNGRSPLRAGTGLHASKGTFPFMDSNADLMPRLPTLPEDRGASSVVRRHFVSSCRCHLRVNFGKPPNRPAARENLEAASPKSPGAKRGWCWRRRRSESLRRRHLYLHCATSTPIAAWRLPLRKHPFTHWPDQIPPFASRRVPCPFGRPSVNSPS
jgi:hypothetical protein